MTETLAPTCITPDIIWDELTTLGATPKEVAQSLKDSGIKGHIGLADSCPIANFLRVRFDSFDVCASTDELAVNGVWLNITDMPVAGFIFQFDAEQYPELIAPYAYVDEETS